MKFLSKKISLNPNAIFKPFLFLLYVCATFFHAWLNSTFEPTVVFNILVDVKLSYYCNLLKLVFLSQERFWSKRTSLEWFVDIQTSCLNFSRKSWWWNLCHYTCYKSAFCTLSASIDIACMIRWLLNPFVQRTCLVKSLQAILCSRERLHFLFILYCQVSAKWKYVSFHLFVFLGIHCPSSTT